MKQAGSDSEALMHTWHDLNAAAISLLTCGQPRASLFARILLVILHDRHMYIHETWDQAKEVYPCANIDKL